MYRSLSSSLLLWLCLAPLVVARVAVAELPAGFTKTSIPGPWEGPVGLTFDDNGRMYVWELAGRVWIVENGVKVSPPLIDISDEVGNWRDHGMLGFALHPNFLQNGWIYLFYAVDHYHLQHAGSPGYDPTANEYFQPSVGRITRYTATAASGFHAVDPASRLVLLGESAGSGCPLVFEAHGVGTLAFGADDSLLAGCGDGGSYLGADTGGSELGPYTEQALAEGILAPREDVGAYRAQLVSSLAGKLLRLDPQTGDGLPSNPYFEPANPRSARSRVFALGFRNPFRFTLRPNTGSHDPNAAAPGSIYVGNVGWNAWEELEVVTTPGHNSGWPIYEGLDPQPDYAAVTVPQNLDAPNPLAGGGCAPFFSFSDLLVQETLGAPSFPNPCDPAQQVPASIPRFMQRRAALTYGRAPDGPALVPTFTAGVPTSAQVGAPGSPTAGTTFGGTTTVSGVWYEGSDFPAQFRDTFFHADFGGNHIENMRFDAADRPTLVTPFDDAAGFVSMLATSPTQGGLYSVDVVAGTVSHISWVGTGNLPPAAVATADPGYGSTPIAILFSSAGSSDPEGGALTYSWNFGDGTPASTLPNPLHLFFGPVGVPVIYTVTLTVRDPAGESSVAQTFVYVNDTPPQISITSPAAQGMYSMTSSTLYPLSASLFDAEQGAGNLACQWRVTLHHNTHVHPEPVDTSCSTSATVSPIGCDGNVYFYTFALTVTDSVGLSTTREVALYPDCASLLPAICGNLDANASRNALDVSRLRFSFANPVTAGLRPGELSRCSVIGDTACNLADLVVLRRYLAGRAPSIEPVCPAAAP